MKKIGVLEPIWNQEPFILPHFKMLESYGVDKIVVLMAERPLPQYFTEHGYSLKADRSQELLKKYFPKVEIHPSTYSEEFGAPLYNEGLKYVQDCDTVLILDTDMLFTKNNWKKMMDFIKNTDYDCYRLNYIKNSINYYMDFDHGLMDAKEMDPRAINPKHDLEWVLDYPHGKQHLMEWEGWMCHHFRGWDKPKSVTKDWPNTEYAKSAFKSYSNKGDWFHCPDEIKKMFDPDTMKTWLDKIK